jgi:DNA-directed RNA polymerase subunit omega
MARITIEDCMEKVPNRFHLVQMASIRAKQLKKGARPLLSSDENKQIVMALREIAAGLVKPADAEPAAEASTEAPPTPPTPRIAAAPATPEPAVVEPAAVEAAADPEIAPE